jgi:hypothetical protein
VESLENKMTAYIDKLSVDMFCTVDENFAVLNGNHDARKKRMNNVTIQC